MPETITVLNIGPPTSVFAAVDRFTVYRSERVEGLETALATYSVPAESKAMARAVLIPRSPMIDRVIPVPGSRVISRLIPAASTEMPYRTPVPGWKSIAVTASQPVSPMSDPRPGRPSVAMSIRSPSKPIDRLGLYCVAPNSLPDASNARSPSSWKPGSPICTVRPVVMLSRARRDLSSATQTVLSSSIRQEAEQPSPLASLPSSHSSWLFGWTTPSPQISRRQVCEQPSPLRTLPSSHCSAPSRTPLPHRVVAHAPEQESPSRVLPSSHCSNGSRVPLPQVAVGIWLTKTSMSLFRPSAQDG